MDTLTIYILYSVSRNLFYVGKTSDLKRRLREHNSGKSGFTKSGIPWTLIWNRSLIDHDEAANLERKLKNLTRVRKIRFMRKYAEGIQNHEMLDSIV